MEKKVNEFAKQVQACKLTPAEEMNLNQSIYRVQLECHKEMVEADSEHFKEAIGRLVKLQARVSMFAPCEFKDATLQTIDKQIEGLEGRLAQTEFGVLNEMTLEALDRCGNLNAQAIIDRPAGFAG